mmetsp:Transcript_51611/g.85773  ORF Transcript_51611/g.85773 Transcript_51611/m.85773 type:complete len:232 (-) Transcript_51611:989-1684(-)
MLTVEMSVAVTMLFSSPPLLMTDSLSRRSILPDNTSSSSASIRSCTSVQDCRVSRNRFSSSVEIVKPRSARVAGDSHDVAIVSSRGDGNVDDGKFLSFSSNAPSSNRIRSCASRSAVSFSSRFSLKALKQFLRTLPVISQLRVTLLSVSSPTTSSLVGLISGFDPESDNRVGLGLRSSRNPNTFDTIPSSQDFAAHCKGAIFFLSTASSAITESNLMLLSSLPSPFLKSST